MKAGTTPRYTKKDWHIDQIEPDVIYHLTDASYLTKVNIATMVGWLKAKILMPAPNQSSVRLVLGKNLIEVIQYRLWIGSQERRRDINNKAAGVLVRQLCEVCGTEKKIEAYYDDYSKPLDIVKYRWLCRAHHLMADKSLLFKKKRK